MEPSTEILVAVDPATDPAADLAGDQVLGGAAEPNEDQAGWSVGFGFLLLFLFLTFSRVTDIWLPHLSVSLAAAVVALVFVIARGRALEAVRNRPALWLAGLTLWFGVSVPFSFWRGGSAAVYLDWCKSAMVFVLIAGLVETRQHLLSTLRTLAASSVLVLVQAALLGNQDTGRLTVGQGVLSNPNDLAQLLLNGVPFLFLPFMLGGGLVARGVGLVGVIGSLGTIGATGSRSGLLGAVAVGLALFVSQPFRRKLALVAVFIAVAAVAVSVAPERLLERYGTLFSSNAEEMPDNEAIESRAQRLFLLRESIRLTFEHPVVGVGTGVFAAASAEAADERAEVPAWRDTHNSYTQVSSEAGLPALAFFLLLIGWSLKATLRAWRAARAAGDAVLQATAYCLLLSFVGYIVICFFSSIAYHVYLPVYAGLSLVCDRLARPSGPADTAALEPAPVSGTGGDESAL